MSSASDHAAAEVVRAVLQAGPSPATHRAARQQLARDWPTLASRLAALVEASGEPVPPEWRSTLRVYRDRSRRP